MRETTSGASTIGATRARGWAVEALWMLLSLILVLGLWEAIVQIFNVPGHLLPRPMAAAGR